MTSWRFLAIFLWLTQGVFVLEKNWNFISRRLREFKRYVGETRDARSHYAATWLTHPEFALLWAIANCGPKREEGRRLAAAFPEYFVEVDPAEKYHFHRHPIPLSVLLAWSRDDEAASIFSDCPEINPDIYSCSDSVIHLTAKSFIFHLEPGEVGEGYLEKYEEYCKEYTRLPPEIKKLDALSTFRLGNEEYLVTYVSDIGEFDIFDAVKTKEIDIEV